MSWVRMTMRFPGRCTVCNKTVQAGETGLWLKGVGVKHERCGEQTRIPCIVCGKPAGCNNCEMADACDIESVSPLCICPRCDSIELYQKAVASKFPAILKSSSDE